MAGEFELDLTGVDDLDQIDSGGKVPPGWYRAKVDEFYEDHNKPGRFVFEMTISRGAFDGKKLFYSLFDPEGAADDKKKDEAMKRRAAIASRLGLVTPGARQTVDFAKAAGREIVVQVIERNGYFEVEYLGLYPLDHPRIKDDVRKALALPPARDKGKAGETTATAATGANGAAKPADTFSDL